MINVVVMEALVTTILQYVIQLPQGSSMYSPLTGISFVGIFFSQCYFKGCWSCTLANYAHLQTVLPSLRHQCVHTGAYARNTTE